MVYDQPISPYYFLARLGIIDLSIHDKSFYVIINNDFYNRALELGVIDAMVEFGAHKLDVARFNALMQQLADYKLYKEKLNVSSA